MPTENEQLRSLDHARRNWIPRRADGRAVTPSTLWRWIHKGLKAPDGGRIRLDVVYAGNTPCVTRAAVNEFFRAVTEAKRARYTATESIDSASPAELAAAGLA